MPRNSKKKSSIAGLPDTGTPNIIEEPLRTIDGEGATRTGGIRKKKKTSKLKNVKPRRQGTGRSRPRRR